ncbi:hypothetical protein BCR44DRAFT_89408 [Catenaria anguillulae PL171]|uniref:Ubinuclein middle domain-containing protein n=1 Tax=Catenaria anguillulae PL171 TaxID=765915 RepID=A0A1Y2HNB4_9FUNG|nr:hypothetical protein BCR44DRAFT_89408 [Catenaria anguillulae PL171]
MIDQSMSSSGPASQQPPEQPAASHDHEHGSSCDYHSHNVKTAAAPAPTPPLTLSPAEPTIITLAIAPPTNKDHAAQPGGGGRGHDTQQPLTQGSAAAPRPPFPPPALPTLLDPVAPDPNATDDSASQGSDDEDVEGDGDGDDDDDGQDSTASASATDYSTAAAPAIPALAQTYVFPTTAATPVISLSRSALQSQDAQPTVIDVRSVIKAAHGGQLPMEFAMRRYGGGGGEGDSSDDDDDDDRDDASASGGSDDDDRSDADEDEEGSGSGSEADNEGGSGADAATDKDDSQQVHDPMDVDSPTPGPGFLSALNDCQETKRRKLDEAAVASAAKAKKKAAAAAKRAAKIRKRHDWYDTQDPFIDDEGLFAGNLDLMVPVKQGFFVAVGPVAVIPKKGVSEVKGGASQGPQQASSKPSSSKPSAAASGKGDPPKSSRNTGNNNKGKENSNGSASNKASSSSANPSAPPATSKPSASSAAAAAAPVSSAAATAPSSARLKYIKLPYNHTDRADGAAGDLAAVLAACTDLISPAIRARLTAFKLVVEATHWPNKRIFPEQFKEPFWEMVRDHLKETRRVPSEPFIWAVCKLYNYNMFTMRKFVATKHVPRFMTEVLEVEIQDLVDELRVLAREVPDMIAKEEEKEKARLAAKAAKAAAADDGAGAAPDEKPAAKPRRKVRLTPEMKAVLSSIVHAVVLRAMFGLWKTEAAARPRLFEWNDFLDRMDLVRSVMDLVKDLFPAGFLLSRDVSLLPVWEQFIMTDEPGGAETVPSTSQVASGAPTPPVSPAPGSASRGSGTAVKRPRADSAKAVKAPATVTAGADAPPRVNTPIVISSDTPAAATPPRPGHSADPAAATSPGGLSTAPSSPSDVEIVGVRTAATTPPTSTTTPAPARFTLPPLPDPTATSSAPKRKRSLTNGSGASSARSTPTPTPTLATTPSGRRLSADTPRASIDTDGPGSAKRPRIDTDPPAPPQTTTPASAPASVPRMAQQSASSLFGSAGRPLLGAGVPGRDAGVSPLRLTGAGVGAGSAGWVASEAVGVRGGSVVEGLLAAGGIMDGQGEGKSEGQRDGDGMVLD